MNDNIIQHVPAGQGQVQPIQGARQTVKNTTIQSKPDLIIRWLQDFYNRPGMIEQLFAILSPSSPVSLRLIDWFVTNYSKKYNTQYSLDGQPFMVHFHYKRELKSYSKHFFDPFCRRERISFQARGKEPLETTVGQLNFFRWIIEKRVFAYISEHLAAIDQDMIVSLKEHYSDKSTDVAKTPTGRRKRRELSYSAMKTVQFQDTPVTVSFV